MNFEDEEYVRIYTRDTNTIKKIGWEGRLVLWSLIRKADAGGLLELDDGDDLVESIAALIEVPEEIVRVGLERLASRSVTERHGASLLLTRHVEAQNARRSDRLRAQDYRDRQRYKNPDNSPNPSRRVTGRHDSSLPAVPVPVPVPLPCPAEEARAGAPAPAAAAAEHKPPAESLLAERDAPPTSLPAALELPLAERSRRVLENPADGAWSAPQTWPEVVAVAEALARSAGHARPRLGHPQRDSGVRQVLGLFADGWKPDELALLAAQLGREDWFRKGGPKGLSSLTPEVLRRAQNARPRAREIDQETARELARTRAMRAQIGSE